LSKTKRLNIEDLPDLIEVSEFIQVFPVCYRNALEIVKQPGFPAIRCGRKYLVVKSGLIKWLEDQQQSKVENVNS
jgi:hypothetical protein